MAALLRRMDRDLGRRQAEDEPAATAVDVAQPEHVVRVDQADDPLHYASFQSLGGFESFNLQTDGAGNNTVTNRHDITLLVDGQDLRTVDSVPFVTQWRINAVASAERRERSALAGTTLDFDGSIIALRKFTSSELLDSGFNISMVAQRQGHGPQVLVKHYSKSRRSADEKAAEHLGRVVHGK